MANQKVADHLTAKKGGGGIEILGFEDIVKWLMIRLLIKLRENSDPKPNFLKRWVPPIY